MEGITRAYLTPGTMATMERPRDDSVSPMTRSPQILSPKSSALALDQEYTKSKSNGYVSSPLRTAQRLASLDDKKLPELPNGHGSTFPPATSKFARPNTAPGVHFLPTPPAASMSSFPFGAAPGATGPSPTTNELNGPLGVGQNGTAGSSPIGRKRNNVSGSSTPPHRRSVQFARDMTETDGPQPTPLQKTTTWETDEGEDTEVPQKERQGSFFGRLKALASPASSSHVRGSSNSTGFMTPNAALSPQSERSEPMYPISHAGESEMGADADIEEDSEDAEPETLRPKRRRKSKRPSASEGMESQPTTPKASRFASFIRDHQVGGGTTSSRPTPLRRSTMTEIGEDSRRDRAGVSEDEGRDRIRTAWRRAADGARGLSYTAKRHQEMNTPNADGTVEKRPRNLRTLTSMAGMHSSGQGEGSPFRMRADRHNSASAQRWRQVKDGIKLLRQRKKDERVRIDHLKSAQLMAELMAGAPAVLFAASMFQTDEHGHKKIPVVLEQLKIRIPSSQTKVSEKRGGKEKEEERHQTFQIDLEYGNGPARMQWSIQRRLIDFANLHLKYKAQGQKEKIASSVGAGAPGTTDKRRAKQPRFPKSAFPYARGARGLLASLEDEEDEEEDPQTPGVGPHGSHPHALGTITDGEVSGTDNEHSRTRPVRHRRGPSSYMGGLRRKSSTLDPTTGEPATPGARKIPEERQQELYQERQRKKLETYLQQMIRWLIFRPDSTRLCKFLELSALAIRLSAEGGFQGKQGLLTIASRGDTQLRHRTLLEGPKGFKERHHPRWTLVRQSYVVLVDGPESLTPYEVFLVDSDFRTQKKPKSMGDAKPVEYSKLAAEKVQLAAEKGTRTKHHIIRLYNSERKLKLVARNERQWEQFQRSVDLMAEQSIWAKKQRFGSFAPVRNNVWARWLVDGRDHMWQVSRAIDNAKDFVYIHDWWLSPELYMRRPAAISQKWRLDRLLQRKAEEGVKIFVIVYRNIESAIPIDSEYTKWSLLDLHENIIVQRSPNQFKQNQFFWAHHEKLVVVDNMMAFVGGVDLCFGRWDDPCHSLTDDKLTGFELDQAVPRDSQHCQMWPGKDYSNPRVQDFYSLNQPYEEMYDRTKVPRMPWHDIAMQIVGQPARDVGRHFVQRWNYILRNRVASRETPVLLPPPEYEAEELERLGMTGSCQIQILRSASAWSIGTPNKTEKSIVNAYVALIESSEHFVYIENQFYISSTVVEGNIIHNKIGDALVDRAIRAHEDKEDWKACLVIPLMPGFQNSVDSQDGTSIRLIMQCQYRSICRGEHSIFGRLRARGIDPEDYIRFYSLRQWGKIGPRKLLTTEQLYIHAKCMVVDDRSCIIGSANINERSMLGSRDSEVAAIVTDTRMIPSFMGGEPYDVGEFPHTLRKRLMREHLGIDVDALYRREQDALERAEQDSDMERIYREDWAATSPTTDYFGTPPSTPPPHILSQQNLEASVQGFTGDKAELRRWVSNAETGPLSSDGPAESQNEKHKKSTADARRDLDVEGYGPDNMQQLTDEGDVAMRDTFVDAHGHETLRRKDAPDIERLTREHRDRERRDSSKSAKHELPARPPWPTERTETVALGLMPRSQLPELPALDDTDIGGPALTRTISKNSAKIINPLVQSMNRPEVSEDCMQDPLADGFQDIWNKVAENNTKLYRQVFRCMPDSEVLDWKTYEKFNDYENRFMQSQGLGSSKPKPSKEAPDKSGPPGSGGTDGSMVGLAAKEAVAQAGKSKGMLGGVLEKLRPGSKASDVTTHTEDLHEKDRTGSPGSGPSSGPTAVPSPNQQPVDEKEAMKEADDKATQNDAEKAEQQTKDDSSFTRQRTIQYSENTNNAPETTATQTNSNGPLQHSTSQKRRRRGTTKSSARPPPLEEVLGREEAEELMKLVQGHLVQWPYDW